VFGNPIVNRDSIPLKIIGRLAERMPDIEFCEFDPNENLEKEGRELNIIDTVQGARKVVLITDIGMIQTSKLYSMHDFDLGYSLKLLKKLGYIDSVRIFGVPMRIKQKDALEQLVTLIGATLP
jgi:Ni,Fe-hydrogenase maturation factor